VLGAFGFVVVAAGAWKLWPLVGTLVVLPAALAPLRRVLQSKATGRDLIAVLGDTGRLQLLFGAALTVALVVA
jgi:1,4-dihydroxy-2-naphthoate polyprenyltransferase